MGWRHQVEALLCAILLLASTIFVAARLLFAHPASGAVNAEISNDQLPSHRRNVHDATSRAKDPKPTPRLQQIATLRELTGTSVAECPTFTKHPRRMKSLGLPRR